MSVNWESCSPIVAGILKCAVSDLKLSQVTTFRRHDWLKVMWNVIDTSHFGVNPLLGNMWQYTGESKNYKWAEPLCIPAANLSEAVPDVIARDDGGATGHGDVSSQHAERGRLTGS